MNAIQSLQQLKQHLALSERMPAIFLGHGSPMNAIENNKFSRSWQQLGKKLPKPQAILVLSAHWLTPGKTLVDSSVKPKIIHDFYGFPEALYQQQYPVNGAPEIAQDVASLFTDKQVQLDNHWGLDHGAWSVLMHLFPYANVPVLQLSIDLKKDMHWQLKIGKTLSALRDRGVLILGSGNIVHNLSALRFEGKPHDWALAFDDFFTERLTDRDFFALAETNAMGSLMTMANPTLEHYAPALAIAGTTDHKEELAFISEGIDLGAVSMRSFMFY